LGEEKGEGKWNHMGQGKIKDRKRNKENEEKRYLGNKKKKGIRRQIRIGEGNNQNEKVGKERRERGHGEGQKVHTSGGEIEWGNERGTRRGEKSVQIKGARWSGKEREGTGMTQHF
jgi:hypothetical protein